MKKISTPDTICRCLITLAELSLTAIIACGIYVFTLHMYEIEALWWGLISIILTPLSIFGMVITEAQLLIVVIAVFFVSFIACLILCKKHNISILKLIIE